MALQHDGFSNLKVFEDAVTRWMSEPRAARPWSPAVDVIENENELVLKADLPDVDLKDIDVRVENQTLTLKGDVRQRAKERRLPSHRAQLRNVHAELYAAVLG